MSKPTIQETELKDGHSSAIVWQNVEDGLSEAALYVRTYDGGDNGKLIELQGPEGYVLINAETLPDLCKLMKRLTAS